MNSLVTRVDLTLLVDETLDGLFASLLYNPDLFEAARIQRMSGHFEISRDGGQSRAADFRVSLGMRIK